VGKFAPEEGGNLIGITGVDHRDGGVSLAIRSIGTCPGCQRDRNTTRPAVFTDDFVTAVKEPVAVGTVRIGALPVVADLHR
jgi:hypothetical protein